MKDKEKLSNSLEESEISDVRYQRLFESAPVGIVILDAETQQITDVNPFMLDLSGSTRTELLKKELWELGMFANAQKDEMPGTEPRALDMDLSSLLEMEYPQTAPMAELRLCRCLN